MSFWKSLFGGSDSTAKLPAPARQSEHEGFVIIAEPVKDGAHFITAGVIRKEVDGVVREHHFIRADRFGSQDEAAEFSLVKARQIIEQQGERMFQ